MCADTITSNYHWVKPEISGSPTTWGVKLNADLDLIDNTVFSNDAAQTAAIAAAIAANILIGEIKMFAGLSPPADWLRCDGTVYANSDIPLLAPILNNAFGGVPGVSNAVPDMRSSFPVGVDALIPLGSTGGEDRHTLTLDEIPTHGHDVAISDPGHLHSVDDPYGDRGLYGDNVFAINEPSGSKNTSSAMTGITAFALDAGGGLEHNNIPPYVALNFIIKFQ